MLFRSSRRELEITPRLAGEVGAWTQYSREQELSWKPTPTVIGSELSGTIGGLWIRAVVSKTPMARRKTPIEVRLVVEIRAGLPLDLELLYNHRLNPVGYTLLAPDLKPWGRGLLAKPEHHDALLEMLGDPDTLAEVGAFLFETNGRIHGGQLEAFFPGMPDPVEPVAEILAVSQRIQAAWEVPWRELAAQLGLRFAAVNWKDQWRLTGTWAGMKVAVRCSREDVLLHAEVRRVPEGLSVVAADRTGERSGNPILDHLLYVRSAHPCLKEAELAGALMAALHPHPGATFDATGLRIPAPADANIPKLLLLAAEVQEALL
jgi:hypothetical protein